MIRNVSRMMIFVSAAAATGGSTTTVAREGTSLDQTNRDIAECRYEANRSSPENPLVANDLARQCLRLRGYREQ